MRILSRIFREEKKGLLSCPTAIDHDVSAGDEACLFRTEVDRELADLFELSPAAEGDLGDELLIGFGIFHDGLVHLRAEWARADAVDRDFFGSEFQGECLGEPEEAGLA